MNFFYINFNYYFIQSQDNRLSKCRKTKFYSEFSRIFAAFLYKSNCLDLALLAKFMEYYIL